ncbi:HEPN domain-containing protein [candidate division KSB1 bacterium]|nr:HEPN domain-containing protein [candidate division KSB1 bacterium]
MKPETTEYLEKAEENIRAADMLIAAQFFEIAVSRTYYAMFYIAEGLLWEEGLESSSHKAIQSQYGKLFAKTGKIDPKFHRLLISGFTKRQAADYVRGVEFTEQDAIEAANAAEEFLAAAKKYLSPEASSNPQIPAEE